MFPHSGFVYTVKFSDGSIKVGMSESDPQGRVAAHRRTMDKLGLSVAAFWISKKISNPAGMETALIWHCSLNCSARINREWFEGVDYESLHRHINSQKRPFSKTALALKIGMIHREMNADQMSLATGISLPKIKRMISGASCMNGKEINVIASALGKSVIDFLKWGNRSIGGISSQAKESPKEPVKTTTAGEN